MDQATSLREDLEASGDLTITAVMPKEMMAKHNETGCSITILLACAHSLFLEPKVDTHDDDDNEGGAFTQLWNQEFNRELELLGD